MLFTICTVQKMKCRNYLIAYWYFSTDHSAYENERFKQLHDKSTRNIAILTGNKTNIVICHYYNVRQCETLQNLVYKIGRESRQGFILYIQFECTDVYISCNSVCVYMNIFSQDLKA